jgi:hypothetical protein
MTPAFPVDMSHPEVDLKPLPYDSGVEMRTPSQVMREPSNRHASGSLDKICSHTLDLKQVAALAPHDPVLQRYVDILCNAETFESLLTVKPEACPPGIRRGISRRMSRHEAALREGGIVRSPRSVRVVTNFFTVPKKSGKLRLVVDGRRVNRLMSTVPHMELPTIHEVADYLLENSFFMTVDGRSYFYQFPISEGMGEFFCANLAGTKGHFSPVCLTRMPMGWSWAPAIAQKVSNVLLSEEGHILGMAWVDNFIFAGKTEEEVKQNFASFLARADRVNLALDTRECTPKRVGEVLGLEFDLRIARYRLSPSWAAAKSSLPLAKWMSPRDVFRITGAGIWSCYARRIPLFKWSEILDLLRNIAKMVGEGLNWDTSLKLTSIQLDHLRRWQLEIDQNSWAEKAKEVLPEIDVWSDASGDGWAFLTTLHDSAMTMGIQRQGTFRFPEWHIFQKEAYAAHQGVMATRGQPRRLMIDNQALVFAIKKRCSSNKFVNELFSTWDWDNLTVAWTDTSSQLADPYTRGKVFT